MRVWTVAGAPTARAAGAWTVASRQKTPETPQTQLLNNHLFLVSIMSETTQDSAYCHVWRAKIKSETPESLYEQTGNWRTCAIGMALDLENVGLVALDWVLHEVDPELYQAAFDLDDLMLDGGEDPHAKADLLRQLDHIEKLIARRGGPEVLYERIKEYAAKHPRDSP